jgi:multiple sugar transport system substrate-binding protein
VLPVLKTINDEPDAYQDNDIIRKYPAEVDLMAAAAAGGFNLGYEIAAHQSNAKAGEIIASNAIADLVQRVVLNGENVAWDAQIAEIWRTAPRPSKRSCRA